MTVRTLPQDPPGGGGAKIKIKNVIKHRWDNETNYVVTIDPGIT
jgi:hypothetical protein